MDNSFVSRRKMLKSAAAVSVTLGCSNLFAEQLTKTPRMAEGPFYPDKLPLDTDNDLLLINDSIKKGVGTITHLSGRILSEAGEPIRNSVVEIWQVDGNGVYLHSGSSDKEKRDANFQGYGRFLTNHKGEYYFRTVRPVKYPGRTPHIHFAVKKGDKKLLTTQMLIKGEKQNESDGLFRRIRDPKIRDLVMAEFKPLEGSKIGEQVAKFDLIVGYTPKDA